MRNPVYQVAEKLQKRHRAIIFSHYYFFYLQPIEVNKLPVIMAHD